jgi:hypothetical protein
MTITFQLHGSYRPATATALATALALAADPFYVSYRAVTWQSLSIDSNSKSGSSSSAGAIRYLLVDEVFYIRYMSVTWQCKSNNGTCTLMKCTRMACAHELVRVWGVGHRV